MSLIKSILQSLLMQRHVFADLWVKYRFSRKNVRMKGAIIHRHQYSNLCFSENLWIKNAFLDTWDKITVEQGVTFGHKVKILTGSHVISNGKDRGKFVSKPVTIKAGAWIASYAILLPGTIIGENSVIAAGSVVRGTIPPNVLYAGNPAIFVKELPHPQKG